MSATLIIIGILIVLALLFLFKFLRKTLLFVVLVVGLVYVIYKLGWFGPTINITIQRTLEAFGLK